MIKFQNLKILKFIFFVISLLVLLFLSYLNFSFKNSVYKNNSSKIFIVKEGDAVSNTIFNLHKKGYIDSIFRFKVLAYLYNYNPVFLNGRYRVQKNDSEYSFLVKLVNGNLIQENITIIEGTTYNEIKNILYKNNSIDSVEFDAKYEKTYLSQVNYPSLEGLCFPDTYKFSSGTTFENFLKICQKKMENVLLYYWRKRDFSLPYKSPYEMLIMASIIEKETANKLEKPIIASVFINRLNKNMRLQADPTVIYGMKNYKGNITKKDLNTKNEYNTYKIKGLPKTPICSPGESSIKAASKPIISDYLYFVADKNGKHVFSKNYQDHVKAVNKYQKK